MDIILRKPVARMLVELWGSDRVLWEKYLSNWMDFEITLPRFFWQVSLNVNNDRLPRVLTLNCRKSQGWLSVFYEYNLKRDLARFIELMILRKCKTIRNNRGFTRQWKEIA
ncbi:MAG: hypothetical protein ABUK01_09375 [Leptospirales bacterium]